jgi:hypothetical protein
MICFVVRFTYLVANSTKAGFEIVLGMPVTLSGG